MPRPTERCQSMRAVLSVAVLPAVFMLPILLILLWRIAVIHDSEARWQRWDDAIDRTHALHEHITDIESSLRGYLLTGKPALRASFESNQELIERSLLAIRSEQADSDITLRVARLSRDFHAWLSDAQKAVTARTESASAGVLRAGALDNSQLDVDVVAILSTQADRVNAIIALSDRSIRGEILVAIACALLAAIATGYAVRRTLTLIRTEYAAERERLRLAEARLRAAQLAEENARIQKADARKGEYVAVMSHELRTPLTAILGFSEVLRDEKVGPVTLSQAEYLDDIIKSGRHLLELIGSVLDLAKIEAGKLDVAIVELDPRPLARDVVDGMREVAARGNVFVGLQTERSPHRVRTDAVRLRQILYNYLANAIKFTPAGGNVTVRLTTGAEFDFCLEVEDDGPGIRAEDATTLFEPFGQLEGRDAHLGTGLGLALTRRLADALGGSVGVRSAEAKGSIFFATFPGAVVPEKAAAYA